MVLAIRPPDVDSVDGSLERSSATITEWASVPMSMGSSRANDSCEEQGMG